MKPIILAGTTYRVVFIYPHKHSKRRRRVIARVLATQANDPEGLFDVVHLGEASCNLAEGDKFDKEAGRVLALERSVTLLPREVRVAIWEMYWARIVPGVGQMVKGV